MTRSSSSSCYLVNMNNIIIHLLILMTMMFFPKVVYGWGKEGHEIVANLAYARLSEPVRTVIKSILHRNSDGRYNNNNDDDDNNKDNAGSPLASVANWADHIRSIHAFHWSLPLHYIDIQDQEIPGKCPATTTNHTTTNATTTTTTTTQDSSWWSTTAAAESVMGDNDNNLITIRKSSTSTTSCHFDYDRDCVKDVCVAGAIMNYTSQLVNWQQQQQLSFVTEKKNIRTTLWRSSRGGTKKQQQQQQRIRQALMFLVHFVGDIHQPLHSARASDKGGNEFHVHFYTSPFSTHGSSTTMFQFHGEQYPHQHTMTLHAVWDTAIIERAIHDLYNGSREMMEQTITTTIIEHNNNNNTTTNSNNTDYWLECPNGQHQECVSLWAEESLEDALHWAYSNVDGKEVVNDSVLDDQYYETRLVVIQNRLAAAGVRLAATLQILFDPDNHFSPF